ncbi:MAG: alanine--glyoxylate aminotransferase family protein [Candidatus Hadarchaeum sp.]|uniref:pyridoxal-phosphate-dependent aminotransferase family protein n=1 Tax=Candidatus Hadarchaeum sp. TaxID=2883567 RepID=UPI00316CF120
MQSVRLMIPGPVPISESTQAALGSPIIAHYGREWAVLYNETMQKLSRIFQTNGSVICIVGSGTAALEAAVASCVAPRETLVVLSNGFFGDRIIEIAKSHQIHVIPVFTPPKEAHDPEALETLLRKAPRVAAVAVVHCETSTGVLNPVKDLALVAHEFGVPIIVDAISSLGGVEFRMDEWHIDICVSASQKALQAPPGLALIGVAKTAWTYIHSRSSPGWYLNLNTWKYYADKWYDWHPHPTTMSTPLILALRQAVNEILAEGLEKRFERHQSMSNVVRSRLAEIGFEPFTNRSIASPTLVVMKPNAKTNISVDWVVNELYNRYKIKIAKGLGPTEGQAFRIGMMGLQATQEYVDAVVAAFIDLMKGGK